MQHRIKNTIILFALVSGIAIFIACSKKNPTPPTPCSTDTLTNLCRPWAMSKFTVNTDLQNYSLTGHDLVGLPISTLSFHKDGTYESFASPGKYYLLENNSEIRTVPTDSTNLGAVTTYFTVTCTSFVKSSPVVAIDVASPTWAESHLIAAAEATLSKFAVDLSTVKTVQIVETFELQ